ncbi:hypothetical protein HPB50_025544 [Hyalomma asiaticum]|uniref:Uncharacterized protein n=1 Tax=Hyalomma asiaticum TaxID=266040 RepID=A0ACB7RV93_HYAAI|nr:hypothetical protein HPB50_025544 [Hyalomma asiaticum]
MSAGKVLALIVVVATFAIFAIGVSWCCWCVRSRFGTADKSIQAVKSMATVADTMDSSARVAKSSLLSTTFPTTATTATMTHPRVTASEPRMPNQDAEVEAPSLPQFASVVFHTAAGSACTSPSPTDATGSPKGLTPKQVDEEFKLLPQQAKKPDDHALRKTLMGVSENLQRRTSKVDLFYRASNAVTLQSARRCCQQTAPGSRADGLERSKVHGSTEHVSAVKALELRDSANDEASSEFESASDITPSHRSSESMKTAARSFSRG